MRIRLNFHVKAGGVINSKRPEENLHKTARLFTFAVNGTKLMNIQPMGRNKYEQK